MKKNVMIVLNEELIEKLREVSKKENRSLNGQIKHFCELGLKHYNNEVNKDE